MNSQYPKSKGRERRCVSGQAAAELAGALVVLIPLLLAATDFGRLYFTYIETVNAARAGAQYGAQSVITAADAAGMKTAAQNDAPDLSGLSATATQCTCMTSTTVAACPTSYCTSSPQATFVEVDTSATFNTLVSYPGIPSSVTLPGKAVMMVEQ
jgi:Flp pilus assembly protein TadG